MQVCTLLCVWFAVDSINFTKFESNPIEFMDKIQLSKLCGEIKKGEEPNNEEFTFNNW